MNKNYFVPTGLLNTFCFFYQYCVPNGTIIKCLSQRDKILVEKKDKSLSPVRDEISVELILRSI